MKIKTGVKELTISACNYAGDIVDGINIEGVTAQNFENVIKAFLATAEYNEKEIYGGRVILEFSFKIEK